MGLVSGMRLPDFVVIGAPKSGSSSLYVYLAQHPGIFFSNPKEIGFFCSNWRYNKGLEWYSDFFKNAREDQHCGEGSTSYSNALRSEISAKRMAEIIPQAKILYIVRHPIERSYSQYLHNMRGFELKGSPDYGKSFEELIELDESILNTSQYIDQINTYLKFFPREALKVVLTEDLSPSHRIQTLKDIYTFLGVDNSFLNPQDIHTWSKEKLDAAVVRSKILAPIRAIPGSRTIIELFPKQFRDRVYTVLRETPLAQKVLKERFKPLPMKPETRLWLHKRFAEPNQALADFLGRDLSHWSQ
jgi:hypothetical protein